MVGGAVPEYRLPWSIFEKDLQPLEALGVMFHYGRAAGQDFTLADLRNDGFDKVLILVGAQRSKMLGLDNEDSAGVIDALAFLRQARDEHTADIGERIGVVGAGDTAMDCVRTARRLGFEEVRILYRRTEAEMPGGRKDRQLAREEGASEEALTVDND